MQYSSIKFIMNKCYIYYEYVFMKQLQLLTIQMSLISFKPHVSQGVITAVKQFWGI